ncbi:MAG: GNAT family N-acetyltransferase [Roseburia sp.]|nr:GNAT family N-acetyltransferase [Roseburia sp.]
MVFQGISCKFSTKNEEQYRTIGELWDFCAELYGREKLRGLGYNWTPESIEYVIGLDASEKPKLLNIQNIQKKYPDARYKEVLLPDRGWQEYTGRTDRLGELYEEIYKEGAPAYEIESFYEDGSCKLLICRDFLPLELLREDALEEVRRLYGSVIGTEGCVWNENYPNVALLREDIQKGDLYGIRNERGQLVAAIAKDRDKEVDALSCWSPELSPAAELARLAVAVEYQNQGMARTLLRQGMKLMAQRGYKGIHFLVAVKNKRALHSYHALGFTAVGETDMFGEHYLCYEKKIS